MSTRNFRFQWGVTGLSFYAEVNKLSDGSSLASRAAATVTERPANSGIYTLSISTWNTAWNGDAVVTVGTGSTADLNDMDVWHSQAVNADDRNGNAIAMACATAIGGLSTYYVLKSGNDSNDGTSPQGAFLTLAHAAAVVPIRSRVIVGAGTYSEGSNVINSAASCHWLGIGVVRIQSSADLQNDGCVLYGASGVVWENFTVENTAASTVGWAGAGCYGSANSGLQTGPAGNGRAVFKDIRIIGGNSDGFYWAPSGTGYLEVERMTIESKWDALYVALPNNASVARFKDLSYICNGPSDHPDATGHSRGMLLTSAGVIYLENVRGEVTAGGTAQTTALSIEGFAAGIIVYAKDCRFRAFHTAGQVADVKIDTSNTVYHAKCDFKTVINAGTLTSVPAYGTVDATSYIDNAISANAVSSGAVTKIQSGLFLASSYTAPDNATISTINTTANAVKAKTDLLNSTVAGFIDANVLRVSGTSISAQAGANVASFFNNAGGATAKKVDDVGGGGGGSYVLKVDEQES